MHKFVALESIARARQLLELVWNMSDTAGYNNQALGSGMLGMTHWLRNAWSLYLDRMSIQR
jgi:hypothetical protein